MGTHAEKDYFHRAFPWYDEVVLNANLVEATAAASAAFLAVLAKPYMIDPVTYAFGQPTHYLVNPRRGEVKKTFRSLANEYGDFVATRLSSETPLTYGDFASDATLTGFAERVLAYQEDRLPRAWEQNQVFLEPGTPYVPPVRVLAPYFFNDRSRLWLELNRRLGEVSRVLLQEPTSLWIPICFDGLLLGEPEELQLIIDAYASLSTDGYLFWPTDFEETRATVPQIRGLRQLADGLCDENRPGVMFYGGYFSALLRAEGVVGISHGVGYGEKRDVVPVVGGGLPPAKYYLPAIHDDITMSELLSLTESMNEQEFRLRICDCTICRGLLERGGVSALRTEFGETEERPYGLGYRFVPTARVYRLTRFHYIESKHRELAEIENRQPAWLLEQLTRAHQEFSRFLGYSRLVYLLRWNEGLAS